MNRQNHIRSTGIGKLYEWIMLRMTLNGDGRLEFALDRQISECLTTSTHCEDSISLMPRTFTDLDTDQQASPCRSHMIK